MAPTAQVAADVTAPTRRLPCMVVLVGREPGRVIPIEPGERLIGRDPGAHIRLEDAGISRRHALVRRLPGAVELCDLGSTNGSWCNGRPVRQRRLADGDCVQLGRCRLAFRLNLPDEDRVLRQLYRRATRDPLTGLHNRASLLDRLEREVARQRRYARGLAVAMLDLDHFKRINDRHGHAAGDRLLAAVAKTIRGSLRACDLAARAGGEEFVLVLPEADAVRARRIADKVRQRVAALRLRCGRMELRASLSAGVAVAGGGRLSASGLLRAADAACYRAKAGGRNRVVVARSSPAPVSPAVPAAAARRASQ